MTTRQAIDRGLGLYVCWELRLVLRVSNRRVGIQLNSGSRAFLPLAKLRLARAPMADAELMTRAEECAKAERYNRLCSRLALGAWL